jgi:hypothetical protein
MEEEGCLVKDAGVLLVFIVYREMTKNVIFFPDDRQKVRWCQSYVTSHP